MNQLVALGDILTEAKGFAKQGLEEVSGFITNQRVAVSTSLESCGSLRDNPAAFFQQLRATKVSIEELLPFHRICNALMPVNWIISSSICIPPSLHNGQAMLLHFIG